MMGCIFALLGDALQLAAKILGDSKWGYLFTEHCQSLHIFFPVCDGLQWNGDRGRRNSNSKTLIQGGETEVLKPETTLSASLFRTYVNIWVIMLLVPRYLKAAAVSCSKLENLGSSIHCRITAFTVSFQKHIQLKPMIHCNVNKSFFFL